MPSSTRGRKRRKLEEETQSDAALSPPKESEVRIEQGLTEDIRSADAELAAFQAFAEEHYEVVEQLPLELQRTFHLLTELERQMQSAQGELRESIHAYLESLSPPQREVSVESREGVLLPEGEAEGEAPLDPTTAEVPVDLETFRSQREATTVGVAAQEILDADSGLPEPSGLAVSELSGGSCIADMQVERLAPSEVLAPPAANSTTPKAVDEPKNTGTSPTSAGDDSSRDLERQLFPEIALRSTTDETDTATGSTMELSTHSFLAKIAIATRTAIRNGEDKLGLATNMYDWVDRHIRKLDTELQKYEDSLVIGLRSGTLPSVDAGNMYSGHQSLGAKGGEASSTRERPLRDEVMAPVRVTRAREQHDAAAAIQAVEQATKRAKPASKKVKKADQSDEGPDVGDMPVDPNEPVYCYCRRVSYGEMVACDNDDCPTEWFHLGCAGLSTAPQGKWYCKRCTKRIPASHKQK